MRVARQQHGVLPLQAARHRVAGHDVFLDGRAHEVLGCDQHDLAADNVGLVDHATHAAEMVAVGVRVHDADHRALAELLVDESQRRTRGFGGGQRIENDPAGVALDEADVGQVEAAHLVNASRHDFEQAPIHVEHGLALQRRVDAGEVLVLQQPLVAAHVPGDVARIGHDLFIRRLGDEAFFRFVKVALVGERQRRDQALAHFQRVRRRRLALGVEMLGVSRRVFHSGALRTSGAGGQEQGRAQRHDGARGCHPSAERSSGRHCVLLVAKYEAGRTLQQSRSRRAGRGLAFGIRTRRTREGDPSLARPLSGTVPRAWKGRHALWERSRIGRLRPASLATLPERSIRCLSQSACLPFQAR